MTTFNTDQWMIIALVFVLGLLIGMWLTSGGRRKWKVRHTEEVEKRRALEKTQADREAHWTAREKEWREQDSLRTAAVRDRSADPALRDPAYRDERPGDYRDIDRDGTPDNYDRRPLDGDRR